MEDRASVWQDRTIESEPLQIEPAESGVASRSAERLLALIRLVAEQSDGLTLSDMARAVALPTSTTLRHLRSLESERFVIRRATDGCFVPGPDLLRIARALDTSLPLSNRAEATLQQLAQRTSETAYLGEPVTRATATYTARAEGTHHVRHVSWVGQPVSRRGTALGLALGGRVDADGAVCRIGIVEEGVTAVAAPVFGATGRIVAAVSVVGPSFRLRGKRLAAARTQVVEAAAVLSDRRNASDGARLAR